MVSKVKGPVHDCDAITVHLLNKLWNDQPCPKLSTVRRNLFGFYERKNASQLLDKQVTDMAKKSSQEWNFDFLNELPQTGRYVWQRVHSCDVPFWYATIDRPTFKDSCRRYNDGEESIEGEHASKSEAELRLAELEVEIKNGQPCKKKSRFVQTSMKDYTRVQKRRSSCRLRLKQLQLHNNRLRSHHISTDRSVI